jgi:hypothetical protein
MYSNVSGLVSRDKRDLNHKSYIETFEKRPFLLNFCACPVGPADRTGVVKIIAFLELKQKLTFFKGFILIKKIVYGKGLYFINLIK